MRIRHRNRMLLGLGALLGMSLAGCQTPPFIAMRESALYRVIARRPTAAPTPSAELLKPRVPGEAVGAAKPIEPPAASTPSFILIGHDDVGGSGVVASAWRSLPRLPESVEPSAIDLAPVPQPRANASPYRPQGVEPLPLPRKVAAPGKTERIVLASQGTMPARVMKQAAPALHPAGGHGHHGKPGGLAPHEGHLVPQPPYQIAPPDVLLIRMIRPRQVPDEAPQLIDGEHLVRPDGTVNVGVYGSVFVAGMTTDMAREAVAEIIAERISYKGLKDAAKSRRVEEVMKELVLDVVAYRSKFYYVIADGGGPGEQVVPILITGNDTVLDAIGKVGGLPPQAAKKKIWVARAHDPHHHPYEMLPVDWRAVAMRGSQATNYQLFPGDRVYVNSDPRLRVYTHLDRSLDLFDRPAGSIILGSSMVRSLSGSGFGGGNRGN